MILTYHEVVHEECPYLYSTPYALMAEHLELLTAEDSGRRTSVTFDDGHISQFLFGLDILKKYRISATFFVTTDWIGSSPAWMGWQELQELVKLGHSVQSHGHTHKFLNACNNKELVNELSTSRLLLEDRLGVPVDSLSCPGGAWNDAVATASARCGYARLYHSDPWYASRQAEGIQISGRLMCKRTLHKQGLRRILDAERKTLSIPKAWWRVKQGCRSVLGDRLYHAVWCALAHDYNREEISEGYVRSSGTGNASTADHQ